ncbi:MAG: ABC transporter permease subunit [Verrucomicrobiia bacterium]
MKLYILRRVLVSIPILLIVSALVFWLMSLAPGDFLDTARGQRDISQETIAALEKKYGLDQPWPVQYVRWLGGAVRGDFGYSWTYKVEVGTLLMQRVPATLGLSLASMLISWSISLPLGILAAIYKDSIFDRVSALLAYAAISLPEFFVALLALFFAAQTGLFPTGGMTSILSDFMTGPERLVDYLWHLALPALVLGLGGVAGAMRIMRANFLDNIRAEYVTTARAKGLSESVVMLKHVLRNAINPFVTSLGFAFSGLLSGALLVENIFNYPGLGQLTYQAFLRQDHYTVLASVVLGATMLIVGNLLADILLGISDPRIRLDKGGSLTRRQWGLAILGVGGLVGLLYLAGFLPWGERWFLGWVKNGFYLVIAVGAVFVLVSAWPVVRRIGRDVIRNRLGMVALGLLLVFYAAALLAPFLAPYSVTSQDLTQTYHPPASLVLKGGGLHLQLYENVDPSAAEYQKRKGETVPIRWLVQGEPYRLFGLIPATTRLFGVEAPHRIYLLGSDSTGRDIFSRMLYGSQVSLSIGLIGVTVTMTLGFLIGALSGYVGGAFDGLAMRVVEVIMCIPGLYLLIALRGALAPYFRSDEMFLLIVFILSFIGWTGTARIIRGMTLSLRERAFVQAAEAMGQSRLKILVTHILPNIAGYLVVSATLSIPGYIMGEASLSFLGLGIQDPDASWGLMLSQAQQMKVIMLGFLWLFLPGLAIFLTALSYNLLGDTLRDAIDPKFQTEIRR